MTDFHGDSYTTANFQPQGSRPAKGGYYFADGAYSAQEPAFRPPGTGRNPRPSGTRPESGMGGPVGMNDDIPSLSIHDFAPNGELNRTQPTVVVFLMDGCGPCQQFKPELGRLVQMMGGQNIYRINQPRDENLILELKQRGLPIKGFPTIMLFPNGRQFQVYSGPRNAENILMALTPPPPPPPKAEKPPTITEAGEDYSLVGIISMAVLLGVIFMFYFMKE